MSISEHPISQYFVEKNVDTHEFITTMDGDTLDFIRSAFENNEVDDMPDIIELTIRIAAKELNLTYDEMLEKPIDEDWYEYRLCDMSAILHGAIIVEKTRRKGGVILTGKYSLTSPSARISLPKNKEKT